MSNTAKAAWQVLNARLFPHLQPASLQSSAPNLYSLVNRLRLVKLLLRLQLLLLALVLLVVLLALLLLQLVRDKKSSLIDCNKWESK